MSTVDISIIIRTKNEERWISRCLDMVYQQSLRNFEVIIVDNLSSDHTVEIAKRYPVKEVVNIEKFLPGLALNEGIRVSTGKFIVCLSAHCIPRDMFWLEKLRGNFDRHENLAGVYGRQLPLSFTCPIDKRDLLIIFGPEWRLQRKDFFFHNANSMLRRDIWEKYPFDEVVTNIEDRLWGKQVIESGYVLAYEPDSAVYHHHGMHQGNDLSRAKGVVSILEKVDKEAAAELPVSMLPENITVFAVGIIRGRHFDGEKIRNLVEVARQSRYIKGLYIVSEFFVEERVGEICWLDRKALALSEDASLEMVLKVVLQTIESGGQFPDALVYLNVSKYRELDTSLLDNLISEAQFKGFETVFPAEETFDHIWKEEGSGFVQIDGSFSSREHRRPVYRALYGLGCFTITPVIRSGRLIGDRVGILKWS